MKSTNIIEDIRELLIESGFDNNEFKYLLNLIKRMKRKNLMERSY